MSVVPQHEDQGMEWLTKFSASEGTRFFWNMARGLYPRPPIDPDLAAKETLNQLSPSILRQIEKDESDDAYFYWARLAVGFWDRLVAHRLTPAVARRVNGVGLASIPEILPLLLRRPWLVEVIEPLKGERLFGDTTALGGFCDPKTGYWNVVGWRLVNGQPKVRAMFTSQPWTAVAKPDLDAVDEDYQWRADGWHATQPITKDEYRENQEWLQTAVRFAMLLGALLEADNTFLRTRDEAPKKERDVSTKAGVPRPPGWITRYVGIDPEVEIGVPSIVTPRTRAKDIHRRPSGQRATQEADGRGRFAPLERDQSPLRIRLRDLALSRPRYGYRRLHVLLRREGWTVNAKRVWRHYKLLEPICDGRLGGKSARASSAWSLRLLRAADSSGVWISSQMSSSADRDSAP